MKKVFMIHENTKPIAIGEKYVQLPTNYVCCVGYMRTEEEKDPNDIYEYEPIFDHHGEDGHPIGELNQFIPGLWFETYEAGCKVLTRILQARTDNDITIVSTYNELAEKYPEALI